jgi:uncharacterized protein (DUF2062 family)
LIYPKVNKFALAAAFVIWNPFFAAPIYAAGYSLGNAIFGSAPVIEYELVFLDHVVDFTRRLLFGSMIIALAASMISYGFVRYGAGVYHQQRQKK